MNRILFFALCFCLVSTINVFGQQKDLGLQYILGEKGYSGVIVLFDLKKNKLTASHYNDANKRVLPASTFKIFHTLFLLENKVVPDTSNVMEWDGTEYRHLGMKVPKWYADTNLSDAFRNSTVWYYRRMSRDVPLRMYKKALKKHKYGRIYSWNKEDFDFWNKGDKMGVSAKEQISLLKRLYKNTLKFRPDHMAAVKEMMVEERTEDYVLRSKTGWTIAKLTHFTEDIHIGWNVGYIEYEDNVYFFAVRLEMPSDGDISNFAQDRKEVTKNALRHAFKLDI